MRINPVQTNITFGMQVPSQKKIEQPQPTFTYSNKLKTLFKKGLLPSVQVDVAGNRLTKKNVTLDHIIPRSKGGKSITGNYMLAEKKFNSERGSDPLLQWATMEGIIKYLNQFIGIRVKGFIGNEYITEVLKTLERANELGV